MSIAGVLIACRVVVSLWSLEILEPGHESRDFVARELEGKSDMVDYFRGSVEVADGQPLAAIEHFKSALNTVPPREIGRVLVSLGHAAFEAGDFATADAAFSRMETLPTANAWEWAQAKLQIGQVRDAVAMLQRLALQLPSEHPIHLLLPELKRTLPPEAFLPSALDRQAAATPQRAAENSAH